MADERKRKKRPLPAERQLRQEAGYGCCKCGHPIFQYRHILRMRRTDPHYRPVDMMVQCPNCHDEATQGVLTEAEQRTHKAEPFNLIHGRTTGALRPRHSEAKIVRELRRGWS